MCGTDEGTVAAGQTDDLTSREQTIESAQSDARRPPLTSRAAGRATVMRQKEEGREKGEGRGGMSCDEIRSWRLDGIGGGSGADQRAAAQRSLPPTAHWLMTPPLPCRSPSSALSTHHSHISH